MRYFILIFSIFCLCYGTNDDKDLSRFFRDYEEIDYNQISADNEEAYKKDCEQNNIAKACFIYSFNSSELKKRFYLDNVYLQKACELGHKNLMAYKSKDEYNHRKNNAISVEEATFSCYTVGTGKGLKGDLNGAIKFYKMACDDLQDSGGKFYEQINQRGGEKAGFVGFFACQKLAYIYKKYKGDEEKSNEYLLKAIIFGTYKKE